MHIHFWPVGVYILLHLEIHQKTPQCRLLAWTVRTSSTFTKTGCRSRKRERIVYDAREHAGTRCNEIKLIPWDAALAPRTESLTNSEKVSSCAYSSFTFSKLTDSACRPSHHHRGASWEHSSPALLKGQACNVSNRVGILHTVSR